MVTQLEVPVGEAPGSPVAAGIVLPQGPINLLQVGLVVILLEPGDSAEEDRLGRAGACRGFLHKLIQHFRGLVESIRVEGGLGPAQMEKRHQLVRGQKAHELVMRVLLAIKHQEPRSPFDHVAPCMRLLIVANAQRDHIGIYTLGHLGVWIRHRIHLLATDSAGIEEIQQHKLVLPVGPGQSVLHIRFPVNAFRHGIPSLFSD